MTWEEVSDVLESHWEAVEDAYTTGIPGAYDQDAKEAVALLQEACLEACEIALKREGNRWVHKHWARGARWFAGRFTKVGSTLANHKSRYDAVYSKLKSSFTFHATRWN